MSIVLELEEDGQIRVRVDAPGERAISEVVDPAKFIIGICEKVDWPVVMSEGESIGLMMIIGPTKRDEIVVTQDQIDAWLSSERFKRPKE